MFAATEISPNELIVVPIINRIVRAFTNVVIAIQLSLKAMSPKWSRRVFWLKFYEGKVSCDPCGLASMRAQCGLGATTTSAYCIASSGYSRLGRSRADGDCSSRRLVPEDR